MLVLRRLDCRLPPHRRAELDNGMAGSPHINPFWYPSTRTNSTITCDVSRFLAMSVSRVRPIRTEQDYTRALARIEAFMDRERSPAEDGEFDVLATLVESYENWHFPVDDPDPIEAIEFRIGQQ